MRLGPRRHPVLGGCSGATASAGKKKGFHALQVVSPGEKGQSAKTLSSSHPPAFGEKAVPALEGRDIFLCPSSPYKASSEVLPLVRLSLSSENVKRKF